MYNKELDNITILVARKLAACKLVQCVVFFVVYRSPFNNYWSIIDWSFWSSNPKTLNRVGTRSTSLRLLPARRAGGALMPRTISDSCMIAYIDLLPVLNGYLWPAIDQSRLRKSIYAIIHESEIVRGINAPPARSAGSKRSDLLRGPTLFKVFGLVDQND